MEFHDLLYSSCVLSKGMNMDTTLSVILDSQKCPRIPNSIRDSHILFDTVRENCIIPATSTQVAVSFDADNKTYNLNRSGQMSVRFVDRICLKYTYIVDIVKMKLILVPLRSLHRLPCTRSLPCMYAGSHTMPLRQ